jgi:hypothetical protein
MPPRLLLDPFPLQGVSVAHLTDLTSLLKYKFVKLFLRLVGKPELSAKALSRLQDCVAQVLGAKGCKVWVEVLKDTSASSSVKVSVILQTEDLTDKVREQIRTPALRTNLGKKLGEDAELVPFAGFSLIEVSAEEELTTADVRDVYICALCTTEMSYAAHLAREGQGHFVGGAGTLIIHSHAAPFCSISQALDLELERHNDLATDVFVWIDILSIPQRQQFEVNQQWLTTTFCDAIGNIGSSIIVLSEWRNPVPFARAWCLWEMLASIQQGAELAVAMPQAQRETYDQQVFMDMPAVIKASFDRIVSENAKASNPEDELTILVRVLRGVGLRADEERRRAFAIRLGSRAPTWWPRTGCWSGCRTRPSPRPRTRRALATTWPPRRFASGWPRSCPAPRASTPRRRTCCARPWTRAPWSWALRTS